MDQRSYEYEILAVECFVEDSWGLDWDWMRVDQQEDDDVMSFLKKPALMVLWNQSPIHLILHYQERRITLHSLHHLSFHLVLQLVAIFVSFQ